MTDVARNVAKIRKATRLPIAVGFGVSTPDDAEQVAAMADGVIVGTAIVKQIAAHQQKPEMVATVAAFVGSLKQAVRRASSAHAQSGA